MTRMIGFIVRREWHLGMGLFASCAIYDERALGKGLKSKTRVKRVLSLKFIMCCIQCQVGYDSSGPSGLGESTCRTGSEYANTHIPSESPVAVTYCPEASKNLNSYFSSYAPAI